MNIDASLEGLEQSCTNTRMEKTVLFPMLAESCLHLRGIIRFTSWNSWLSSGLSLTNFMITLLKPIHCFHWQQSPHICAGHRQARCHGSSLGCLLIHVRFWYHVQNWSIQPRCRCPVSYQVTPKASGSGFRVSGEGYVPASDKRFIHGQLICFLWHCSSWWVGGFYFATGTSKWSKHSSSDPVSWEWDTLA